MIEQKMWMIKKYLLPILPVFYILAYWIICIIIPSTVVLSKEYEIHQLDWSTYLIFLIIFVLLISPFIFILPYKLSRLKTIRTKILYILFGLVVPYILIYTYILIYISFITGIKPGF